MGIKIIEGTTLKKQNDLLVNEELVRLMKWIDGAVGKTVNDIQGTIVGVFRDIRNNSFYGAQSPSTIGWRFKSSLICSTDSLGNHVCA